MLSMLVTELMSRNISLLKLGPANISLRSVSADPSMVMDPSRKLESLNISIAVVAEGAEIDTLVPVGITAVLNMLLRLVTALRS